MDILVGIFDILVTFVTVGVPLIWIAVCLWMIIDGVSNAAPEDIMAGINLLLFPGYFLLFIALLLGLPEFFSNSLSIPIYIFAIFLAFLFMFLIYHGLNFVIQLLLEMIFYKDLNEQNGLNNIRLTRGERIRQARENAGLSIPDLADETGISSITLSDWESNKFDIVDGDKFNRNFKKLARTLRQDPISLAQASDGDRAVDRRRRNENIKSIGAVTAVVTLVIALGLSMYDPIIISILLGSLALSYYSRRISWLGASVSNSFLSIASGSCVALLGYYIFTPTIFNATTCSAVKVYDYLHSLLIFNSWFGFGVLAVLITLPAYVQIQPIYINWKRFKRAASYLFLTFTAATAFTYGTKNQLDYQFNEFVNIKENGLLSARTKLQKEIEQNRKEEIISMHTVELFRQFTTQDFTAVRDMLLILAKAHRSTVKPDYNKNLETDYIRNNTLELEAERILEKVVEPSFESNKNTNPRSKVQIPGENVLKNQMADRIHRIIVETNEQGKLRNELETRIDLSKDLAINVMKNGVKQITPKLGEYELIEGVIGVFTNKILSELFNKFKRIKEKELDALLRKFVINNKLLLKIRGPLQNANNHIANAYNREIEEKNNEAKKFEESNNRNEIIEKRVVPPVKIRPKRFVK